MKATSSPPSLSRRAGGPVCLPRSICCLLPEVTGLWNRKSRPLPSEENGKILEVGCKPGETRVNQGGRLAASDPEGQAGFARFSEKIRAGRSAALPTPCPPVHPRSPAFADPGGGRCPALVLWGQGLSAAPGACAAPGTQEDLKSASKKGILGATGRIPVLTGRQSCQRWLLDGLARETEDTSGVEDVPAESFL